MRHKDLCMQSLPRPLLIFAAATILFAGCSSSPKTASAAAPAATAGGSPGQSSAAQATQATYAGASSLSDKLTTATITDPSLNNMQAATLTIPAGWKLDGIMMQNACIDMSPLSVFRAYSPDGLSQYRMEPIIGWKWQANGKATTGNGCAPISSAVSAADFLQYYVGTIQGGVHVVGTMPVSATYSQTAQGYAAQLNQPQGPMAPHATGDTAALRIQVMNGSFLVEERLRVTVQCSVNGNTGWAKGTGSCWARVDILSAPQGRLDALVQLVDSNNLPHGVNSPQYTQAVMQRLQQRNAAQGAAMLKQGQEESAAFSRMMTSAFQQDMAQSAAQHQAFMQQQESSFQSSMNNANASMNARSTAASDFVDYALDQQTVAGPNGTAKVSSAYSQTWTNGTQWYQTNNPNTNPNGVLQGNWTQTTQVHGNGQPK
jgi:hypothetical protein